MDRSVQFNVRRLLNVTPQLTLTMPSDETRRRIDAALADVQQLAAVGSAGQVRSLMRVFAEASLAVAEELQSTATEIRHFNESMTAFNTSAGKVSDQLVKLNRRLTAATWVIAFATGLAAVGAIWSALK